MDMDLDIEETETFFEMIEDFLEDYIVLYSTIQTLGMVIFSTIFAILIGFPLGVFLNTTNKFGIAPKPVFNVILSRIIDILRSFPFVILMILVIPFTRLILGTPVGTLPTIIPLSIAAAPFVARITETGLNEVEPGMIQAARAMGSTNWQIIYKVLIPEAMPSVVSGITLTVINLISYSAMAGTLGGGGLGDLAYRFGYQRFQTDIMIKAVIVIIVMVATVQFLGTKITNRMLAKR